MPSFFDSYSLPEAFPEPGKARLPQRPQPKPFLEAKPTRMPELPSLDAMAQEQASQFAQFAKAMKPEEKKRNPTDDIIWNLAQRGALDTSGIRPGYFNSAVGGSGAPVAPRARSPLDGPDDGSPDLNSDVPGVPAGYFRNLYGVESGNNPSAVNRAGGTNASGLGGLLPSTYRDIMQEAPHLGLSPDGILDPAQNTAATRYYTEKSVGILKSMGLPVTSENLYALHHFGYAGGPKLINNQDAPLQSIYGPEIFKANPYLYNYKSGADLMGLFRQKFGGSRG
jgi:hypothetical protein